MDDDANRTFERLYDDGTEKNKRSFFDWLRGKEETDEEKLRKKLNKEIKVAARKRAEIAEEEARVAERREQPETRKLKKRWRKRLYEKSQQQLAERPERDGQASDGYELAQHMVAERIVRLFTALEEEDLRKSERKALKIQIDFMGLLSEKLSHPEIEVPEEVTTLWHTIVTASQPPTPDGGDGDTPVAPGPEASRPQVIIDRTPETKDTDHTNPHFLAAVVAAIRRVTSSNHEPTAPTPETTAPHGIHDPSLPPRPTRQEEYSEPTRSNEAVYDTKNTEPPRPTIIAPLSNTLTRPELPRAETVIRPEKQQKPRGIESTHPEPSLDELSTAELLEKARPLSLGAGRYLEHAFMAGEIDRAGLIKVLKAHTKGLDYRSEFRRRHEAYRQKTAASPEYLAHATDKNVTDTFEQSIIAAESEHEAHDDVAQLPSAITLSSIQTTVRPDITEETVTKLKKQANLWLLAGSLLLVIILGAVIAVIITL